MGISAAALDRPQNDDNVLYKRYLGGSRQNTNFYCTLYMGRLLYQSDPSPLVLAIC